jgi:hypothetical protein
MPVILLFLKYIYIIIIIDELIKQGIIIKLRPLQFTTGSPPLIVVTSNIHPSLLVPHPRRSYKRLDLTMSLPSVRNPIIFSQFAYLVLAYLFPFIGILRVVSLPLLFIPY